MKKFWDLKKGFSNLELEEQGWGIIMGVTRLLLLGPFYTIQTKRDQTFWRGVYVLQGNCCVFKGQVISKCLLCVFNFFQKTNENKLTWGLIVVKSNSFIHFLEETLAWKNLFDFVWPLAWGLQKLDIVLESMY